MSEEAIQEYLQTRKIFFNTEKLFAPLELQEGMGKDKDSMPSRFGPGLPSSKNREGKRETRKDQLTKQSFEEPQLPDSSKYWVID
jgi:hypothetical protein